MVKIGVVRGEGCHGHTVYHVTASLVCTHRYFTSLKSVINSTIKPLPTLIVTLLLFLAVRYIPISRLEFIWVRVGWGWG